MQSADWNLIVRYQGHSWYSRQKAVGDQVRVTQAKRINRVGCVPGWTPRLRDSIAPKYTRNTGKSMDKAIIMTVDEAILTIDDAQRECTRCGCGSCDQCRVAVLAAEVRRLRELAALEDQMQLATLGSLSRALKGEP